MTPIRSIRRGRSALHRLRDVLARPDGGAATEFALVALPFIAVVLAILQTALVFVASQLLEVATGAAGRQLLTGQAQGMTQAQYKQLVCKNLPSMLSCGGVLVDVQSTSSFSAADTSTPALIFNPDGTVKTVFQFNPGNPGQIVTLRVMYLWPIVGGPLGFSLVNQSNGQRLLISTAVFKAEPYR